MTSWIVEAEWFGKLIRANDLGIDVDPNLRPDNLTHDKKRVWGIVGAKTKDEALDALTEYMVEHGDEY